MEEVLKVLPPEIKEKAMWQARQIRRNKNKS